MKVTLSPAQILFDGDADKVPTGDGVTVILTGPNVATQPPPLVTIAVMAALAV